MKVLVILAVFLCIAACHQDTSRFYKGSITASKEEKSHTFAAPVENKSSPLAMGLSMFVITATLAAVVIIGKQHFTMNRFAVRLVFLCLNIFIFAMIVVYWLKWNAFQGMAVTVPLMLVWHLLSKFLIK
ncbi:hypothetical protein PCE1_004123 [Barthelona sp. PCE]